MDAYLISYQEDYRAKPTIDVVLKGSLVKMVDNMIDEGQIDGGEFFEDGFTRPTSESEAVKILENDGYTVEEIYVFDK